MAHNTLNGGTVTEIGGGKAMLGGAVYEVDSGKVLSDGTVYTIGFSSLPPVGTALNDMTWEEIRAVADAGLASSYFSVGDRKGVVLNGKVGSLTLSGTYYCYIIGIDHNKTPEGSNKIHFQFGYTALSGGTHIAFVDSGYAFSNTSGAWFNMNNSATNVGGWESSLMRTVICPAFKKALPSDLQEVLRTVLKYTDNVGGGTDDLASFVTMKADTIFLLSEYEVFGVNNYANTSEPNRQKQYAYYAAGNTKIRKKHDKTSDSAIWWTRSVRVDSSTAFCCVYPAGSSQQYTANIATGFAPAFCV